MREVQPHEVIDAYRAPEAAEAYRTKYAGSPFRRFAAGAEQWLVARALCHAGLAGTVLDAPCGTGRFLSIVARRGKPIASDASEEMLAVARRAHPQWPFVVAAYPHLPFAEGAFPGVACFRYLHHVVDADLVRALAELRRVSRGPIVASLFLTGNLQSLRRRRRDRTRGTSRRFLISRARLRRAASEAGLRVVRIRSLCPGISALHVITFRPAPPRLDPPPVSR